MSEQQKEQPKEELKEQPKEESKEVTNEEPKEKEKCKKKCHGFHGFGPRCHAKGPMGFFPPMFGPPCHRYKERKCECGEIIPKRKEGEPKIKNCPKCGKDLPKKHHGFGMRCHKMKKFMKFMFMMKMFKRFGPRPSCPSYMPFQQRGLEVHHYIHFGPPTDCRMPGMWTGFGRRPMGSCFGRPPMGPCFRRPLMGLGFGRPPMGPCFRRPPMAPGFGRPPMGPGFGRPPMGPGFGRPPMGPHFGRPHMRHCKKDKKDSSCKKTPCEGKKEE